MNFILFIKKGIALKRLFTRYHVYVEMACNGLFGAGLNSMIGPPDPNKTFTLSQVEIVVFDRHVYNLIIDVEILHDIAKVTWE